MVSAEAVDEVLPVAFPVEIGGPFELVDHFGNARGSGDFDGAYPLIFFGYARCESICPVALRTMLDAVDLMAEDGRRIQPVLITIDPRPKTVIDPSASIVARSPGTDQRTPSIVGNVAAVFSSSFQ